MRYSFVSAALVAAVAVQAESTVYKEVDVTITSCGPEVTNCPARSHSQTPAVSTPAVPTTPAAETTPAVPTTPAAETTPAVPASSEPASSQLETTPAVPAPSEPAPSQPSSYSPASSSAP
ncbi:hypothetical protein KEM56_000276, partial [Ascosphaera pollenicola]